MTKVFFPKKYVFNITEMLSTTPMMHFLHSLRCKVEMDLSHRKAKASLYPLLARRLCSLPVFSAPILCRKQGWKMRRRLMHSRIRVNAIQWGGGGVFSEARTPALWHRRRRRFLTILLSNLGTCYLLGQTPLELFVTFVPHSNFGGQALWSIFAKEEIKAL